MKHSTKLAMLLLSSTFALASCGGSGEATSTGAPDSIATSETEMTYTVTFNSMGGSAVAPVTVKYGEKLTKPADPTKEGYTFKEWCVDEICVTAFNFRTMTILSDWTLYASWTEGTTISSDRDSDSIASSSENTSSSDVSNTKTVYFKDPAWWTADGAATSIHYWDASGKGTTWPGIVMTLVSGASVSTSGGNVWSFDLDLTLAAGGFIFARHNPDVNSSGQAADWGAKTVDLKISEMGENNMYDCSGCAISWGNPGLTGVWSTYSK